MVLLYRKMKSWILWPLAKGCIILAVIFLSACDLFEYSPNQIILKAHERDLNKKNINKLLSKTPGDTLKIILMGDTQRFYDEVDEFVRSVNQRKDVDLVIHSGDISDFGLQQEFTWVNDIMSKLKVPYVTVIGNHDLLANGSKVYSKMFGPFNFSFTYAGIKFILFDSNSREHSFNGTVPDIPWIEEELADSANYNAAILVSHIPPYDGDFDPQLSDKYALLVKEHPKVRLSLHGHQHSFQLEDFPDDGVTYVVSTTIGKRGYAEITITGEETTIEKIYF